MKKTESKQLAIEVKNLQKSFGKVKVLEGISFGVKRGSIMALLGPNGAGKTTTIRILSTLIKQDDGLAVVNGNDTSKKPEAVRADIGLTGQFAAVDEYLTGKENLMLMGRLYRLSTADTKRRTEELLQQVDLVEASTRQVKTYSGGMRRRLDLAMSLIAMPPIIFLDEPTTGLDPRSRLAMWEMIKNLASEGITILLTTQYMDEADHLADKIVVIDHGKVIAEGTADTLKSRVGADRLEVAIAKNSSFEKARKLLSDKSAQIDEERRTINLANKGGAKRVKQVLEILEKQKIEVESISMHRPTLDDVFLSLTGHSATKEDETEKPKARSKK